MTSQKRSKSLNKFKVLAFLLVGSALILSVAVSLAYTTPIGADIHFHYRVAEAWSKGQFGMMSEAAFKQNLVPYPPLFHLLLVPSLLLNKPYEFVRVLQSLFYPLAIATSMWLMWRHSGKQQAIICGMLMMSSVALMDGAFQVKPQSIDIILLPIAIHFFLQEKRMSFILVSCVLIYSHGLASIAVLGGLFLYGLFNYWKKEVVATAGASMPIIMPSIYFLTQAIQKWGPVGETPQERMFWGNPLITLWYIGPVAVGFAVALYNVYKWKKLNQLDKMSTLTVFSMLVMLPLWADRCLQYCTVPLAYITANQIKRVKLFNFKGDSSLTQVLKIDLVMLLILAFITFHFILGPWMWLATRAYYIAPEEWLYL